MLLQGCQWYKARGAGQTIQGKRCQAKYARQGMRLARPNRRCQASGTRLEVPNKRSQYQTSGTKRYSPSFIACLRSLKRKLYKQHKFLIKLQLCTRTDGIRQFEGIRRWHQTIGWYQSDSINLRVSNNLIVSGTKIWTFQFIYISISSRTRLRILKPLKCWKLCTNV